MRLTTFAQALGELEKLGQSALVETQQAGGWAPAQVLRHLGQSIEYSMLGFPELKPAWFRATIGPLVKKKFLKAQAMSHNLEAPIPGAAPLPANEPLKEALAYLVEQIRAVQNFQGEFKPHFAYGPVSRSELEQLQAMHIANHLNALKY